MSDKIVKVSVCPDCNNWVRVADKQFLEENTTARNEFKNEVFEHNLEVKEVPVKDFKRDYKDICSCND